MTMPNPTKYEGREFYTKAFCLWCDGRGIKLSPRQIALADTALSELPALNTGQFNDWWLRNYWRFNAMRELERKPAREAIVSFLSPLNFKKLEG